MSPVTVAEQSLAFEWPRGQLGRIWLLHPREKGISDAKPFRHIGRQPDCVFGHLKAAISIDIAHDRLGTAPLIYVVPELSIDPNLLSELRDTIANLPPNVLVIAGLGHLTPQQCDEIEANFGSTPSLWDGAWHPGIYANTALIATGGGPSFLEAKNLPSKFETEEDCHWPHRRIRIFKSATFRFAVLICSELLPTQSIDDFVSCLKHQNLDAVFWLQHNPTPRSNQFDPALQSLFATAADHPLIISANKRPDFPNRKPCGVSSLIAPAYCFGNDKRFLLRAHWSTEPTAGHSVRAVFVRYDADAHEVTTLLPRDISLAPDNQSKADFLKSTTSYVFDSGRTRLVADQEPRHFQLIFTAGRERARAESGISDNQHQQFLAKLEQVESHLSKPNSLLNFLDVALPRLKDKRTHENHKSHSPAPVCDCWEHRKNFDSLFEEDTRASIAELALAIAALDAVPDFNNNLNIKLEGTGKLKGRSLLLASDPRHSEAFEKAYFQDDRHRLLPVPAIVLQSRRKVRLTDIDAAHVAPAGALNAGLYAKVAPPRLYSDEFWSAVRTNSLPGKLETLLAPGGSL